MSARRDVAFIVPPCAREWSSRPEDTSFEVGEFPVSVTTLTQIDDVVPASALVVDEVVLVVAEVENDPSVASTYAT